jgi:NAD-specific glutamate dehydrogenase
LDSDVEAELLGDIRKVIERAMHWFLSQDQDKIDIHLYEKGIAELKANFNSFLLESDNERIKEKVSAFIKKGVPEVIAFNVVILDMMCLCLDVVWLHKQTKSELQGCASVFFLLMHELDLLWLRNKINLLPDKTVWESLARRTIREEFNSVCRHLSLAALQDKDSAIINKVDSWLAKSKTPIARYRKLLAIVHPDDEIELEKITVLIKELRGLCVCS